MTLDTAIHKDLLINILKDIFTDQTIAPYLGLKGGTAALLFYDLSRFSVDLDFDLLNETKEDVVFENISTILRKYGHVKEQRNRYSMFFLLSYKNKLANAQNIKVEVNKRAFGSRYEVKTYLGLNITVMIKEDMVAHKMVAMYERMGKANRDIFDVWFFLRHHWPINTNIIEQRTHMTYKMFLHKCIDALEKRGSDNILSGLGELLNNKQKDWVKSNLVPDTLFLLKQHAERPESDLKNSYH